MSLYTCILVNNELNRLFSIDLKWWPSFAWKQNTVTTTRSAILNNNKNNNTKEKTKHVLVSVFYLRNKITLKQQIYSLTKMRILFKKTYLPISRKNRWTFQYSEKMLQLRSSSFHVYFQTNQSLNQCKVSCFTNGTRFYSHGYSNKKVHEQWSSNKHCIGRTVLLVSKIVLVCCSH